MLGQDRLRSLQDALYSQPVEEGRDQVKPRVGAVIVPLLVGAIADGVLSFSPQTYRSEPMVGLPPAVVLEAVETGLSDGTIDPALTLVEAGQEGLTVDEGEDGQTSQLILIHTKRDAKMELDRLVADLAVATETAPRLNPAVQLTAQITRLEEILALREEIIAQISGALMI